MRLRLGRSPVFVVNQPELMHQVLRDNATFGRGGPITERFRAMFGNGLGVSEGEVHRRQRTLIKPAFNHARVAEYAEIMTNVATTTAERWQDGATVQVEKEMDELALTNVTRVIFSDDIELDRQRFMQATTTVLAGLFKRVADATGLLGKLPTQDNRRYNEAKAYLHDTINRVIAEYRAAGINRGDLLGSLMYALDEDGRQAMSDQQLHDEIVTLFIAGSNTISNTLAWTFHEVATRPQIEKNLQAEVDEVLGGRPAGFDDVPALEYTKRIITETLRYRTQGLFLARVTTKDAELGGYTIPADATVMYSFHALNHSPLIHDEPEQFDPDRWLPERAAALPKGSFLPFSLGVNQCIAEHFAWTEMIISLATLTGRWRLASVPGHVPKPKLAITMPVDSLPMTAHRRT